MLAQIRGSVWLVFHPAVQETAETQIDPVAPGGIELDLRIEQLDRRLGDDARKQLVKDIRYAPAWIADIFRSLADRESAA